MKSTSDLIKTVISQLRRSDTQLRKYGATFHKYSFNPCLQERDLIAFEEKYKLKLPDDYRQFIKYIGNGGAGPKFGINQLHESILWCVPEKPFLWTQNIDENDTSFPDDVTPGVIQLTVEENAFPDYLVVNGAAFGTIWHSTPAEPLITFNKSFIRWYVEWLETMTGGRFEVKCGFFLDFISDWFYGTRLKYFRQRNDCLKTYLSANHRLCSFNVMRHVI